MIRAHRAVATISLFYMAAMLCPTANATTVKIRAAYGDKEGASKMLVIVRSIDGQPKEFARELSRSDGSIAPLELQPGIYEAIATCPYGYIHTAVRDFAVNDQSLEVTISLTVESDQTINFDQIGWRIQVLDHDGRPAANAIVIGRNAEASTGVSMARTDKLGFATLSVPVDGALIAIIYGQRYWTEPAYKYDQTRIGDCRQRCLLQAKARLEQRGQVPTIRVPN